MYTKFLRMIIRLKKQVKGHCDGDTGGSNGHCS